MTIRCQHLKPAFSRQFVLCTDPIQYAPFPPGGGVNGRVKDEAVFGRPMGRCRLESGERGASCSDRSPVGGGALDSSPFIHDLGTLLFIFLICNPGRHVCAESAYPNDPISQPL